MAAGQRTQDRERIVTEGQPLDPLPAGVVIDADYMPLTTEELRRALQLVFPDDEAQRLASDVASTAQAAEAGIQAASEARARGSTDPDEVNPPSWMVSPEVFAIAWCIPEFSARIDEVMERARVRWSESRLRVLMAQRRLPLAAEPPEDLVRRLRREVGYDRASWTRRKRAMADRLGVPRPDGSTPTDGR